MFWRGVLGYLPVNIVQGLVGFGTIVVFTRLLSPHQYGAYALAFSVAAIVHLVVLTWMEAAMARFYAAEPNERGDLFATLYRAFAVTALVAPAPIGLAVVLAPLALEMKLAIGGSVTAALGRSLLKMAQERRRAAGEVKGFAFFDIAQASGGFALGVLFAVLGAGAASPFAGAGVATALCLVWSLGPELAVARTGRFDPERLRRYAAYGLPLSASLVLSVVLASTDRFVLAAVAGEAAVGAYHAGYSLSNRTLDILFLWLGMAGGPAAVAALEQSGETALHKTARQQASLMILIALPAAVGLALVAKPLSQLMVGPQLAEAAGSVTPWIAAGALFSGLTTHYFNTAFTLSRRPARQLVALGVPALANLVLCLVLIPRFGLMGAAWSTVASFGLGLVASYLLMQDCIRLPVPWDVLGKSAAGCALMSLAVLQTPSMPPLAELLVKATVGMLVYGVAAVILDIAGVRSFAARRLAGTRLAARKLA